MPDLAWIHGRWMPIAEACVPVLDRGYMFGDGVYEVIRSYRARLWAVDLHLTRLARSLREVDLAGVDLDQIRALVEEASQRSEYQSARVYIQVTRGVAARGHLYPKDLRPTLLVTVEQQAELSAARYAGGAAAITLPETRWARRDIKSLNLLPNILAKQQAHEANADEAILVQPDGIVTEGASNSVFLVQRGVLVTREEGCHILASITRALALDCARRLGLPVYEGPFTCHQLRGADELFLAGTSPGIWAITRLDGQLVSGRAAAGPVTSRLAESFFARIEAGDDQLSVNAGD